MPNYDEECTLIEVYGAITHAGVVSADRQRAHNFLALYDEWFDSSDYWGMVSICEEIREDYTDPYAERVFGKTAAELSDSEREQMWSLESEGGLPMVQRRAIYELWSEFAVEYDIVVSQRYYDGLGLVFHYGFLGEGGSYDQYTGISFETEIGENPAPIGFGEPLPVIPPTDGLVNTGWVNYYGETVTSTAFRDLLYSPTFKAVWEEAPATVDYTITYETEHGTAPTSKTVTVNEGESYTLTADDLPTLEAEGYTFKGWSANVGDTISADTTLTAIWEIIPAELPEWTSGDGWALYGGVKLPVNPTDYPYVIIGYDKADERYELISSKTKFSYGTKTLTGEGERTGFIANSSGGSSVYSFDGTQWVFRYKTSGTAGGMLIAFTIEETVWANFDILNYDNPSETLYKTGVDGQHYYPLEGFKVLEWDGNTHGLTKGSMGTANDFTNYYRVSGLELPDLDNFIEWIPFVVGVDFLITEDGDQVHNCDGLFCYKQANGLWAIENLNEVHTIYYAENPIEGLPEAGLYFYNDGTRKTTRFAFKVVKGWIKQDTYKDGAKHDVYKKTSDGWVKCDVYAYKDDTEE